MPNTFPEIASPEGDKFSGRAQPLEETEAQSDLTGASHKATGIKEPRLASGGHALCDKTLSESETRFRTIFENSGSGIALVDMQGHPVECNSALQTILGYTEAELCGMTFTEFTHVDDRELDWELYGELTAGKRDKYEIEKRFITKGGRVIWANLIVSLVRDGEGAPKYAVGMLQDVTERKRAEAELRRVSERLQLATRAGGIGIWDWDIVKDKLVWDDAMYDLFGVRKEDFSGAYDAWASSLAPEDFEQASTDVQAALRGERDFNTEFRIIWPDGSIHFIKGDAQTFRDAEGRPIRMVGVNYDITERKLEEERVGLLRIITMDVAAAQDLSSALKVMVRHICEKTGWALGQAWIPQSDGAALECSLAWLDADSNLKEFGDHSKGLTMRPGIGLPGRVWASRQAAWVRDVTRDANFPRAEFARKSGLMAALGVPILSNDDVIAVLEFYLREPREEDERLVKLVSAVATQIGLVCARKLVEEKLRWSEEMLRLILDSAAEGIFGVDLEGRCTFCNAASLRLLGYDRPADLLGRNMHALIAGLRADGTPYPMEECPAVRALQNASGSFSDNDVFWRKEGTCFPVEYWSYPMFREGRHVGAVMTFNDITERRRAEEQNRRLIHELGERVKELTALHHAARVLQDGEKSIPELLREIVSLLPPAWQYPEVTAARIDFGEMEFKTPNFTQTRWSQVAQFTAGGLQGTIEVVYLEEKPEADSGPFLLEERNLIDSLAEMIRSTLNRRFVQEALRASEERFAKAFQASPEPISIYRHRDDTLQEVNDRWMTVYGFTRGEALGRTSRELNLIAPETRQRLRWLLDEKGFIRDFEVEFRTKHGELRQVSLAAEQIVINNEPCDIFLHNDITERKAAEEELKASREQLRALSESLRKAKEEEGIRIARELHDELGAALTSLKWSLMRLDKVCVEEPNGAGGRDAHTRVEEMVNLVDATINTVRRISSELRPGVLDDLGLISAIEWHAHQFQAHTGIEARFDSMIENIDLTREQATTIFRILQEATTNILRHAQATKVNIFIEEEEDEFVLEVSDNGKGITESEKLGTRSLGLLGMRERAHSIGGKVEINGTPGKGTTLIVRLPLLAGSTI